MSQGFRRHGARKRRGLLVTANQKIESCSSVPTCRDRQRIGCTEGPVYLWGEGVGVSAGAVSPSRKEPIIVRLTDGHGAAGLQTLIYHVSLSSRQYPSNRSKRA